MVRIGKSILDGSLMGNKYAKGSGTNFLNTSPIFQLKTRESIPLDITLKNVYVYN
jgi:hypothetical protein